MLSRFVEADTLGLQRLREQPRIGARLDQAIQMLAATDSVYLVAHRRSLPVAFYLSYALSQMNVRNVLVDSVGGLFHQQASQATPRDVVFAISTKSYSPDVVQVVRESAHRGVRLIALTDSPLSPLVEHASISLGPMVVDSRVSSVLQAIERSTPRPPPSAELRCRAPSPARRATSASRSTAPS